MPAACPARPALLRTCLAALLALLLAPALAPWLGVGQPAQARAEGEAPGNAAGVATVDVPDLAGRGVDDARHALEALGLQPVLVPVAGPAVDVVERQEPPAGSRLAPGAQVMLRHGIALRLETRVPAVVGRLMADVGADLEGAYALEVEVVVDPARQEGEILATRPAAGEALWYRGVLALKVASVAPPAYPTSIVPALVGLEEQEAVQQVLSSGLRASVEVRRDPSTPAGRVISQEPASGAEMVSGGTVFLRVSGDPLPELPPELPVLVPPLLGMEMNAALGTAQAQGFVPTVVFQAQAGAAPWTVLAQEPAPGAPSRAGAVLALTVALPAAQPVQVSVPSLAGLAEAHAAALLQSLGLGVAWVREPSGWPAGLVFAQAPAAGSLLPARSIVSVRVSTGGPPPVASAVVPSLVGMDPLQAWLRALAAGFSPRGLKHLAPGLPVDKVDAQSPAPGSVLPRGSELRFFTPLSARVPDLSGLTRSQAIAALEAAGFNAQPQGPQFGIGTTLVTAQAVAAGRELARGSLVRFTYIFTVGGGLPAKVAVPSLVGLTKEAAASALQAVGLGIRLVREGPVQPGLGTRVTVQAPAPGTLRLVGSLVDVTYVEVAGVGPLPPLPFVTVPDLAGLSLQLAEGRLGQAGLRAAFERQGPARPGDGTRVLSQSPAAGVRVLSGTTVRAVYEEVLSLLPPAGTVSVPDLVGATREDAQLRLQQRGLQGQFERQGAVLPGNGTRIISQAPAAGTRVLPGSTVRATFVEVLSLEPQPLRRAVPSLVGMTREAAQDALQALGLQAQLERQGPVVAGQGTRVVSQSPAAGTQVFAGSTVRVTYIEVLSPVVLPPVQPLLATVPSLQGLRLSEARPQLEALGLQVAVVGPAGLPARLRVVGQSPAAGARVARGSTVRLTVVLIP